jgi:outer membrane lipoprotein-sorting protein
MPSTRQRALFSGFLLLASSLVLAPGAAFADDQTAQDAPAKASKAAAKPKPAKTAKSADAAQTPELTADEIVDKANAYLDDARVMTADFVQVGPDGSRTEGQLYLQRPGKLLFHYNPPSPLEVVADGRSLAIRDQKLGTQDLYFIAQTPLKFLLADHIDLRRDVKVLRVGIDENAATIEIEDKQTFGGKSDITLVFDPQTFALKQWTVVDPQGFQTVVSLFDVDLVSKPDPDLFKIDENAPRMSGPKH